MNCARVLIAGVSSGVGKTSISLGLVRALTSRDMKVQTYKVGPDYLDPQLLSHASSGTCYNLDSWITDKEYMTNIFAMASGDADISIIEGVMGLFDGADPASIRGSTADIALTFSVPVILVVNSHGIGGSIAAIVKGYKEFHPEITIAGVIANRCGSSRHIEIMKEALASAAMPPLVGAVPRDALPAIPDRHLGLLTPEQDDFPADLFHELGAAIARHVDLDSIVDIARSAAPLNSNGTFFANKPEALSVRIGIARDKAFFFYYPDNLMLLEYSGAQLVPFSPLADKELPDDLDALYIGGGYPEEYAEQLSTNESMLKSVRNFSESGAPVYAECGGLIYLSESLTARDGKSYIMADVLPCSTMMLQKLRTLGYTEVTLSNNSIFGLKGTVLRGHEFHYSELKKNEGSHNDWNTAYSATRRSGQQFDQGFLKDNVLASYIHLHFGSNPAVPVFFTDYLNRRKHE